MGLRCLLSHDFGEPELEREREEQGNEVIITVNEVKTCTRCGERRIVSENTEVTSLEQLTETAADETVAEPPAVDEQTAPEAPPETAQAGTAGPAGPAESTAASEFSIDATDPETDDAEVLTDDEPDELGTATNANMTVDDVEAAAAESAEPAEPVEPADDTDADAVEAAGDDGIILPNESADEAVDREPGEWPEYDGDETPTGDEAREWPSSENEDEGFSADEPTDPPKDMTFGGGFTPEITDSEASMADGEASIVDGDEQLSFTRAEETTVEYEPTVDDIKTEFYCPECGLARKAGNSSMRAGDICPECKRGYISERPI